jgi:hypothetical protein
MSYSCEKCQKVTDADMQRRGPICFSCHLRGIRIGFTYGKDNFHGPTIGERQRQTVEQAKINGYNPEPVGNRWV